MQRIIKSLLVAFFFLLAGGLLEEAGPSPTFFLFPDLLLFCFRFCLDFLLDAIIQNVFEQFDFTNNLVKLTVTAC